MGGSQWFLCAFAVPIIFSADSNSDIHALTFDPECNEGFKQSSSWFECFIFALALRYCWLLMNPSKNLSSMPCASCPNGNTALIY
jgi:hypothetical protein